jgi:hypothetical protein
VPYSALSFASRALPGILDGLDMVDFFFEGGGELYRLSISLRNFLLVAKSFPQSGEPRCPPLCLVFRQKLPCSLFYLILRDDLRSQYVVIDAQIWKIRTFRDIPQLGGLTHDI